MGERKRADQKAWKAWLNIGKIWIVEMEKLV